MRGDVLVPPWQGWHEGDGRGGVREDVLVPPWQGWCEGGCFSTSMAGVA